MRAVRTTILGGAARGARAARGRRTARGRGAGVVGVALAACALGACGGGEATLPGLDEAPAASATVASPAVAPVPDPGAGVEVRAGAPPEAAPLPEGDGPPDAARVEADWRAGLAGWYACLARPGGCDASFAVPGSAWAVAFAAEVGEARAKALADADGPAAHRVVVLEVTARGEEATVVACAYDRRRFTLGGYGWEVRNWTTRMTWGLRWHAGAWRWASLEERITHLGEDGCGDGA